MNLIGNAIKFTKEGSITISIKVSPRSTDRQAIIKLSVEDTGIGIPKDKQAFIFERFTRLTPSDKGLYTGSGLGLYLVQKLVTAMKGEINLKSKEQEGSQFIVILPFEIPLLDPEEYEHSDTRLSKFQVSIKKQIKKTEKTHSGVEKPFLTPRVLLVEDNPIAQKIAQATLTSLNCQVDVASSGETAIEFFTAGKYHLVFLDLGLPTISGYQVASHFRTVEKDTIYHVPIIALTAHTTVDIQSACLSSGMTSVMNKPLSREQAKFIMDQLD